MLRALLPQLLDLVAPPACGICGAWLVENETAVCAICAIELPPGNPEMTLGALDAVVTATRYTALVREAIRAFKFGHQPWRGAPLGQLVAREAAALVPTADVVLPVPLPADRLRERGYNQASLLARAMGPHLGLRVRHGVLVRQVGAAPQSERDAGERGRIGEEWEVAQPERIARQRVLLVDDVITTGATVRSLALRLREHGAIGVSAAAVAWTPLPGGVSPAAEAAGSPDGGSVAEVALRGAIDR